MCREKSQEEGSQGLGSLAGPHWGDAAVADGFKGLPQKKGTSLGRDGARKKSPSGTNGVSSL